MDEETISDYLVNWVPLGEQPGGMEEEGKPQMYDLLECDAV